MGLRLLALLCLVGAAFAGPFQRETRSQCSTHCPTKTNNKFDYEVGKTYSYEYKGENYITVAGNRKQKAQIEGMAEISYPSRCEGVLKLKNVRITEQLPESELEAQVRDLEIPISFHSDDGKIGKVCPSHRDTKHSINIKKGVLSSLVNSMDRLDTPEEVDEHDSLGKCRTKYTVKYTQGLEIRKEKNLKSCTNRHSSVTSLITKPYDTENAKVHSLPIFPEEHYVCTQTMDNKVMKTVRCDEKSVIKPMKQRDSIVEFEGRLLLNLLSVSSAELEHLDESHSPESLLYNLEEQKDLQSREREVEKLLRDMCPKNKGVMDISVSEDFVKLVSGVQSLPLRSLEKAYKDLKHGKICDSKKLLDLFVDALLMGGSDSGVSLFVQLYEKKEIHGVKANLLAASLALIPKPTRETIEAIEPLLRMADSATALLGVSAVLHRFCSTENCDRVPVVQRIIAELIKKLSSSSSNDKVFSVLKAFGNIGYHGKARESILRCAKDSSKPMRLRLAAVDAFRRVEEKRPQELLDIYLDTSEDYELRIIAFATVMRFADEQQLDSIKETIEKESDSQVAGYTKTFIQNMNTTSSPLKKHLKSLLNKYEMNHPKSDYWADSKNLELSAYSEALNMGASVEANLVNTERKMPRSANVRLDLDVLEKSMNVFEMGVRAEGLKELVEKLIGLKNKVPKIPKWDIKNIFAESGADASFYLRINDVEIVNLLASDITAMGEVIKIAELMTKMSHERKTDFSHSLLFLNSKLVIPSVTGRSYSIGLTGSATVGLTASSKVNLLNFPRSADVQTHFQPSVNVELSTTVGMKSPQPRSGVRLISRMHLESDVAASFQIKDGKLETKLTMPSENVALVKYSSEVREIDADHKEKRLFEKMQKKIDYCFDKLEKPLGISVCGKVEVPKPFIVKSFPFVQGVGDVELALKRTDSFTSYVASFEIPSHHSHHMRFRASIDTPHSTRNRRFAAEVDIMEKHRGQKKLIVGLTSPFGEARGSGSVTRRKDLIEGSLEVRSGSRQLLAINASTTISKSRSGAVYKSSFRASVTSHPPIYVTSTLSDERGRKKHLWKFDIKSNISRSKPVSIKGTITKEGIVHFSKEAEWKMSSNIDIRSPIVDTKVRSALEKKSGSISKLSTSVSADYQAMNMKNQSLRLSGSFQESLAKMHCNVQFVLTERPEANFVANWDRQGESGQNLKNDFHLKYGHNPEETYITIQTKHKNAEPSTGGLRVCQVSVKAPQFGIDSDATFNHSYRSGDKPHLHVGADIRYKGDKHVKGSLEFDCASKHLLKATTRAEFQCPGGKFSYNDAIEEVSPHHYKGKSEVQWKEDKRAKLEYRYQKLEQPGNHYEIEGSLTTPSLSSSPMKSKIAFHQDEHSLGIEGQLSLRRDSEYSMEAQLNKNRSCHVSVRAPQADGDLRVENEEQKKSVSWDMKLKSRSPRHVVGSAVLDLENEKRFKLDIRPDADRQPERKIVAESALTVTKGNDIDSFDSRLHLQVFDIVTVSLTESGDLSLMGRYETTLDANVKHYEPITIEYGHQISRNQTKSVITLSRNHVKCSQLELEGSLSHNGNQREVSGRAALKSLDNHFEDKEISMRHLISNSGSSTELKSQMRIQQSPSKVYEAEWNSELQPSGVALKAQVNTPHESYEKQAMDVSFQRSENAISSSVTIDLPNKRGISMSADIQTQKHGFTGTLRANKILDIVNNVKVHFAVENESHKKSISAKMDVNNASVVDIEVGIVTSHGVELNGHVKIASVPNLAIQGVSFSFQQTRSLQAFSGKVDLANNKKISVSTEIKEVGDSISLTVSFNSPSKIKDVKAHVSVSNANKSSDRSLLLYIDVNGERKGDAEFKVKTSPESLEIEARMKTSRTPEVSAHLQIKRHDDSFLISGKIIRGTSPLWSTVLSKQKDSKGEKFIVKSESFQKTVLDLQVTSEVSEDHMKFVVKASGRFSPVSLSISSSSSEKSAVRMQISACKESPTSTCYTLKAYHKSMRNSNNYNKKLTFDLEKSSEKSTPEAIGSAHFVLTSSDHDYRSKINVQYQKKSLGYEVKIHRRLNESDPCTMDLSVSLSDKTSRVRSSLLHSSNSMLLAIEAIPNDAVPKRRLLLEMKSEIQGNEVTGHVKLLRLDDTKPFLLTGKLEKRGLLPLGKVELHYSPSSWFKVVTLEITNENERSGMKSVVCRLYREDESLDVSMTFKKQLSRYENMYGCDWRCKADSSLKEGGLSWTLSKSRSGKPESLEISFYAPNIDVRVQGKSQWSQAPSESSLKVVSSGRVIKEIKILSGKSCFTIDVKRSDPFFNGSFCWNKHEGKILKLVSIDANCHEHKCLDVSVSIDNTSPSFVDVNMAWERKELLEALSELTGLKSVLRGRSLKELRHDLEKRIHRLVDKIKPHLRDIVKTNREMREKYMRKLREILKAHSKVLRLHADSMRSMKSSVMNSLRSWIPWNYIQREFLTPLRNTLKCLLDGYTNLVFGHIPQMGKFLWDITRKQFEHCLKKFCSTGTFCHDFMKSYERDGFRPVRDLIQSRISSSKEKFVKFWWPRFLSPWRLLRIAVKLAVKAVKQYVKIWLSPILTPWKLIRKTVNLVTRLLNEVFGKFIAKIILGRIVELGKKVEDMIRQKAVDLVEYVIHRFNDWLRHAERDEDFRTAVSLVKDAKRKAAQSWERRDEIVKEAWEPVQESISENIKKAIDERFELKKYDPTEGEIQFRVRNPFGQAQLEIIRDEILAMKLKFLKWLKRH